MALEYRIAVAMVKKKNPHAVALGKVGGRKSGKARMEKLTAEQRQAIARHVQVRWAKATKRKSAHDQ